MFDSRVSFEIWRPAPSRYELLEERSRIRSAGRKVFVANGFLYGICSVYYYLTPEAQLPAFLLFSFVVLAVVAIVHFICCSLLKPLTTASSEASAAFYELLVSGPAPDSVSAYLGSFSKHGRDRLVRAEIDLLSAEVKNWRAEEGLRRFMGAGVSQPQL